LIEDPTIDKSRLVKMAIVHDLAEAIVGDFTPFDNISNEEKHRLELNAIETFVEQLNNTAGAIEIKDLWLEYEAASSQTAILCKDIDKFEMIMQAYEYEQGTSSITRKCRLEFGKFF
jgi:putative hydrolase of HD superfamily